MSRLSTYVRASKHLIKYKSEHFYGFCLKNRYYVYTNIKAWRRYKCPQNACGSCPLGGQVKHTLEPIELLES